MNSQDIGRRVAQRLDEVGMTRAELAERIGCDPSKVSNLTRGARQRLDLEFLQEVAGALQIDVAELVTDGNRPDTADRAIAAMNNIAEAWRVWMETERERVANERLRIEEEAKTRRQEIASVDATKAQERLVARETEREATVGMRIALEALSRTVGAQAAPHAAGRSEPPARRAHAGAGA